MPDRDTQVPSIPVLQVTEAISSSTLRSSPIPSLVDFLQHITSKNNVYQLSEPQMSRLRQMLNTLCVHPLIGA